MTVYRLVDINLRVALNVAPMRLSADAAMIANRDLFVQGYRNLGYIEAARVDLDGRVLDAPVNSTGEPRGSKRNAELIDALTGLGYSPKEAKKLAATAPAGAIEVQLAAVLGGGSK